MPTVFCTRCGQENPEDSRFCARCGAPLTRPGDPIERAVDTTSTISITGIESLDPEHPDDPQIVTDVAVEGLPSDSALLVVKRARPGVRAVVAPGGSIRDADVIEAAQTLGVTMYFTGTRHFAH